MPDTTDCSPSDHGPNRPRFHEIWPAIGACLTMPICLFFLIGLFVAPISSLKYLFPDPKPVESVLSAISRPASCQLILFRPQQMQSGFVYSMSISNVKPPGHAADVHFGAGTPFNNTGCDVGQAVRVTSLYSDGSCPLHQDACAKEEQAAGLQTCALMASQGVTSSVISSEAWRIMGEASDTVGASPDSTKFTKFTSRKVCLPGEPSLYFYVSNTCTEDSNAPPVYFDVKITERSFSGSATKEKRCQDGEVVLPWAAIAHIWLWWLGVPVLSLFALVAVMVAGLCMAECMGIRTTATVGPTNELKAGEDSSAPDVEMGAPKAAVDDLENDFEKHPDKLVTAIS